MKSLLKVKMMITMFLVFVGCILLLASLVIPPSGQIHESVLVAFGEILTFVGLVFNMKYRFQSSLIKHEEIFKWAMKRGIDVSDIEDELDDMNEKETSSRDDVSLG